MGTLGKDALEGFLESTASLSKQSFEPGLSDKWLLHLVTPEPHEITESQHGLGF